MRKDLVGIKVRRIKFSPEDEIAQLLDLQRGKIAIPSLIQAFSLANIRRLVRWPRLGALGMQAGFSPGLPIINAS
ncbi:hypothetical protein ACQZ44_06755 [Agrobacterium vitis]